MKISMRDIEVGDLNNVSIMILSKFARELHQYDGTVLKLTSPDVLLEASKYANSVNDPQLRILYERLKLELRKQLNSAIPSRAEVGNLVIDSDLRARVQKRLEARQIK